MRVWVGDAVRTGRAIDLREFGRLREIDLTPSAVAEAVRAGEEAVRAGEEALRAGEEAVRADWEVACGGDPLAADCPLVVECPNPGPAHEHVGAIAADVTLARQSTLAAAARSRGYAPPQADELAAVRARLDALDPSTVDLRHARERVADAGDAEAEWRERVATLRGRVRALRDAEADPGDAEAELAEATRRLSDVETERIAAEQALARARECARESRETRRERLRLEDRAGNLRRAARDHLAGRVVDSFEEARDSLLGGDLSVADTEHLPEAVADALAVVRVADLDAPVALARDADPFGTPEAATRWLDAPVLLV